MINMPWDEHSAPNAMIEVADRCNVRCRFCYRPGQGTIKDFAQIERDLETALRLRRLHTVTITGGEPTLHPRLLDVVRLIRSKGCRAFLLTNGVKVSAPLLDDLRAAGLDAILFHVDQGQRRPDLPPEPSFTQVTTRLSELTGLAAARGLDVSASFTLLDESHEKLVEIVDHFLSDPRLTFLFLAKGIDTARIDEEGPAHTVVREEEAEQRLARFEGTLEQRWQLKPFCFIPSRRGHRRSWISYFVPVVYTDGRPQVHPMVAGRHDHGLIMLPKLLTGRHIHKTRQNTAVTLLRVAVNGVGSGRLWRAVKFLVKGLLPGTQVRHKIIVYDNGPTLNEAGEMDHCAYCPTAVVRGNELKPCCVADLAKEPAYAR